MQIFKGNVKEDVFDEERRPIMKELQIFKYNAKEIRTTMVDGTLWWVLKDVCAVLDLGSSHKVSERLDEDERNQIPLTDSLGRWQETTIINESGLYNLILRSDKSEAKQFKRWVTHEVLPSIRKDGGYIHAAPDESEADILAKAVLIAQKTITRLNEKIESDKPLVLFAGAVSVSSKTILIGELAKLIKQNGVEIGQNRLFEWLRNNGYLIRRQGTDYNMPTQRAMEQELFEIKETIIGHADGHTTISKTPKVTGKGQIYFINKFVKAG